MKINVVDISCIVQCGINPTGSAYSGNGSGSIPSRPMRAPAPEDVRNAISLLYGLSTIFGRVALIKSATIRHSYKYISGRSFDSWTIKYLWWPTNEGVVFGRD